MTHLLLLFFFSVHTVTHTVNTMCFTIRHETKSSAAVLSWVKETSSQASKAKKRVYFLLVTVGMSSRLSQRVTVQRVRKDSKAPCWMHFPLGRSSSVPQASIVYNSEYESSMFALFSLHLCNQEYLSKLTWLLSNPLSTVRVAWCPVLKTISYTKKAQSIISVSPHLLKLIYCLSCCFSCLISECDDLCGATEGDKCSRKYRLPPAAGQRPRPSVGFEKRGTGCSLFFFFFCHGEGQGNSGGAAQRSEVTGCVWGHFLVWRLSWNLVLV